MYITPEKELYSIIQQFHSGKYAEIAHLDLDAEFDFSNILYDIEANFYKIRSLIKLNDFTKASESLTELDFKITKNTESNQIDAQTANLFQTDIKVLNAYIDFKKFNSIDTTLLNSIDTKTPSLALVYKHIILNDSNTSSDSIDSPDLDFESYLYTLLASSPDNAINIVSNLKSHYSDSLIIDFAVAWLGLAATQLNNDTVNTKNSYYFFEELTSSSNTDSIKNSISLLVSHLKLGNIPEANDCLQKIVSLDQSSFLPSWDYSLLINKIALASQALNSTERETLTQQIATKFPNSPYVNDLKEKSDLFDSIVASFN